MLRILSFRNFMIGLILALPVVFYSCGGGTDEEDEEVVVDEDYYEFQDMKLIAFDIPAIIKLPDETANIGASTKPEVIHTESDIYWEINVGPNFQLLIEDFGDITDLVKEEKRVLADTKFYKIKYIIDEPDMILYERELIVSGDEKAEKTVGVEHKSYHVYGQKTIDKITYALHSRADGYEKMIIELMAKSIRSFRQIEK